MMSLLAWLWGWFTFTLFWGTVAALGISLFFALHPVSLRVRVRLSRLGQRGEFWVAHLFGLLRIGTVASRHSQCLVLECGPWRRVLKRWGRTGAGPDGKGGSTRSGPADGPPGRPPTTGTDLPPFQAPPRPAPDSTEATGPRASPPPSSPATVPVTTTRSDTGPEVMPAPPASPDPLPQGESRQTPSPAIVSASDGPRTPPRREPASRVQPDQPTASAEPEPATIVGVSSPPPPPPRDTPTTTGDGSGKSEPPPSSPGFFDRLRTSLKKGREKLRGLWRKFRHRARQVRRLWVRLSPIFWRFWANLSGTLTHGSTGGQLRVGLPEPHLTGVFTGMVYQVQGIFVPDSVRVRFEPVFSGTSLYCRTETRLGIQPWRILLACLAFLFDREVWTGARDLWRWYRARTAAEPAADS